MSKLNGLLNFIAQAPGQVFGGLLGPSPLPPGLAGQLPPGYEEQARQQAIQQMAISALSAPRGQQLAQATQAGQTGYRSSLVDMLRMREIERMQGEREKEAQRVKRLRNSPDLRAMLGNTAGDLSPQTLETIFAELATASPSSTDDIKEYEYALKTGTFTGTFQEWLLAQKRAAAAKTKISLPPAENQFEVELGENAGKRFDDLYGQALSASKSLDTMRMLRPLVESENFISGPGSQTILYLQKALRLESTRDTEAYFAAIGQEVAERIKAFGSGTGLSDADREFAKQIAGGSMELTKEAILRIMDINERSSINVMSRYNNRRNTLGSENPKVFNFYEELPIPSTSSTPSGSGGWSIQKE